MERVEVTTEASELLKSLLEHSSATPGQTLRLIAKGGGQLGLSLDDVRDGDEIVEVSGQPVLAIAGDVVSLIDGATIAVTNEDEGKGLTILPPSQK